MATPGDVLDAGAGQGGAEAGQDAHRLVAAPGAGPGPEHLARRVGERADERDAAGGGGQGQGAPSFCRRTIEPAAAARAAGAVERDGGVGAGAAAVGVVEEAEAAP